MYQDIFGYSKLSSVTKMLVELGLLLLALIAD